MDFRGSFNLLIFIYEEWKLLTLLTIIFLLYFYYTNTFTHFEKKGIQFMKPTIFLGNLGPRLFAKISFHEFQLSIYNYFKGQPYGGIFEGRRPVLYLFDPNFIKAVTIRDFDHFVDRNLVNTAGPKYLTQSLLNLKGKEWKGVRSILTPTFSSARLRNMLPLIQHCTSQMVDYLKKFDKKDVEMKDTMGHFTLEVIGVCAFGIDCDALNDENAHFVKVAEKFNAMSVSKRILIFSLLMFAPSLFRRLNVSFLNQEACAELVRLLAANKRARRDSQLKGNDFLQLMIDAAEKDRSDAEGEYLYMDDHTIDAQSLLFLFAGFETSSTLLSFAMHTLATRPDIQDKLRKHVEDVTSGKEMTYEVLADLTYLEGFLLETLRIYPPVSRVDRVCTKKYTLPGTTIEVNPGEVVAIPVYGIHMDPDIYPEPKEFRPERFMGEEKQNRPSHHYLAFGAGPRNCIGMRFAMISAKLAMVTLLRKFRVRPGAGAGGGSAGGVAFDTRSLLLKAQKGVWVNIEAINSNT